MRIQHNITAMNAYRNYNNNTSAIAKNLEKLSSGYKINRAGDDAAGLAVSQKMRLQIAGLSQAQKNAKSGISLVQTAEGALQEVHEMLERMYTLAEQSANGTFDKDTDRAQLQKELESLQTEITRIGKTANFNGIGIFSQYEASAGGTYATADSRTVEKATIEEAVDPTGKVSIAGTDITLAEGDGLDELVTKINANATLSAKYTASASDGKLVLTEVAGQEGQTTTTPTDFTEKTAGSEAVAATATMNVDAGDKGNVTIGSHTSQNIGGANATGTDSTNGYSWATTGNDTDGYVVTITRTGDDATTNGEHDGITFSGGAAAKAGVYEMSADDVTAKLKAALDGSEASGELTVGGYTATVTKSDLAGQLNEFIAAYNGDEDNTEWTAKLNEAKDGILFTAKQKGAVATTGATTPDDAELTDGEDPEAAGPADPIWFAIGAEANDNNKLTLGAMSLALDDISVTNDDADSMVESITGNIGGINIADQDDAWNALDSIKNATNAVSDMRGTLGAVQNRLDHTIKNLSVMQENMQDAESVIRDTDVAEEMMAYTKNNILVQSAQAMLAQANQLPQGVLQLLG